MLVQTYSYAVKNREKLLKVLDIRANNELYKSAQERWIVYKQQHSTKRISAIDSSWNYLKYHGYYLYAVEAVSVYADGSFATDPKYDVGIDTLEVEENEGKRIVYNPTLYLSSRGMDYEYLSALDSIERCDYVLVDGSLLARYYDRRQKKNVDFYTYAKELMSKQNIVFVAKTSESNLMLKGTLGDIYYFTKATKNAGFSMPYYDQVGITIFYARLDDYQPCLKVEVPGNLDQNECRKVFDVLGEKRFNGYPYALRLAHQRCKISDDDMQSLAVALGLDVEAGAREVLNE
ncbi:MAG: DNA double-strand break repair nuclease NurA [Nitrososphaerota archaeon]